MILEEMPEFAPLLPELSNPSGGQVESPSRTGGSVANGEELGHLTVSLAQGGEELGPVDAKGSSIWWRGEGIAREAFLKEIKGILTVRIGADRVIRTRHRTME